MATIVEEREAPLGLGLYHAVTVGFTLTESGPLWSVDIHTTIEGVSFVGNGATLEEAAANAQAACTGYGSRQFAQDEQFTQENAQWAHAERTDDLPGQD